MIEKENNKRSRFFVKDIKNEKFESITPFIKEIVDIKGKRFILWKIIIKINTCLKNTSCSQRIKMINFDNYVNENKTKHNKNWPYIPDHPYRILIIGGSGSEKTNLLLNLIENQTDIHKKKIFLHKRSEIHMNQNTNI